MGYGRCAELSRLAGQHEMRRDDNAALGLLLDCLARRVCEMAGTSYQQMLRTLAARYPREPLYLDLLARYFGLVEQDYPQAIHTHRQLLAVHPGYLEAHAGLVAWYNRNGDRALLLEQLGTLLRLDPDPARVQYIKHSLARDSG